MLDQYERFYQTLEALAGVPLAEFVRRGGYTRRECESLMPLTVEWIGETCVSLAHWGEQNGDAMRDPEVCFRIRFENKTAEPISLRNDYMGMLRDVYTYDENGKEVGVRLAEKKDQAAFCRAWFRNLKHQGFLEQDALKRQKFHDEPCRPIRLNELELVAHEVKS